MSTERRIEPTPSTNLPLSERGAEVRRVGPPTFIIAKYACGCDVKVRDAEAVERMAKVRCRRHEQEATA